MKIKRSEKIKRELLMVALDHHEKP